MAATKYLDYDGLLYFWQKLKTKFPSENTTYTLTQDAQNGHIITLTPSSGNPMSVTIPDDDTTYTGSSPISVNSSTHVISHNTSGATAGSHGTSGDVTPAFGNAFQSAYLTVNDTGHVTSISSHWVTIPNTTATTSSAGLMSSADKSKLDSVASGAEANVLEGVKVDGTALTVTNKAVEIPIFSPGDDIFIGLVPDSSNSTLDDTHFLTDTGSWERALRPGDVDNTLSPLSTNPVQNSVITNALDDKADLASPTFTGIPTAPTAASGTNTTQIATTAFVNAAVAAGGVTIDSALSTASENPVQNKVITTAVNAKAPLASPALTGTPTAPTAASGTNSTQIATTAFVATEIAAAQVGAATFQGTVNANTDISNLSNYKKGWYWVVATAGTYVGQACEVGDMIFAVEDRDGAYSASDFSVLQTNLDITAISNAEIDTILAS